MMIVNTPISIGELLDKISILKIKKKHIQNEDKQKLIKRELKLLENTLNRLLVNNSDAQEYLGELIQINSKLWNIENDLRECERQKNLIKNLLNWLGQYILIMINVRKLNLK